MCRKLPASTFVGCLLVAYGPALVFLIGVVARRSQLTVLGVTAAFFELVALLVSSLLWLAMPNDFSGRAALSVVISVALQETARVLFVFGFVYLWTSFCYFTLMRAVKAKGTSSTTTTDLGT